MSGFDICPKCPKGSRPVKLIGGTCYAHFQNPAQKVERTEVKSKAALDAAKKKPLNAWFKEMLAKKPKKCENCRKALVIPHPYPEKTCVAHILPKRHFKSVATNDDNAMYLCKECHDEFDNGNPRTMPVIIIAKQRYNLFKHLIADNETRYVPEYLK